MLVRSASCCLLLLLLFVCASTHEVPTKDLPQSEKIKMAREEIEKLRTDLTTMHQQERELQHKMNNEVRERKRREAMEMEGVKEETFTIGPFGNSIAGKPKVPEGKFGVLYWGDWKVLAAGNGQEIPRGHFFLHHIFIYEKSPKGKSYFVSGSSDERVTWGPDFSVSDDAIHYGDSNNTWTMNGALQDIDFIAGSMKKVLIQYTVRYWTEDYIPKTARRGLGLSYTSVPKHTLNDMAPPVDEFGLVSSTAQVGLNGPPDSMATMVYVTGHIHVGGWSVIINEGKTQEELCYSRAVFSMEEKCYLECPKCPGLVGRYPALEAMTYCEEGKKKFQIGNGLEIIPQYDQRCSYMGLHGSVFAWYVPDDQEWFEKAW